MKRLICIWITALLMLCGCGPAAISDDGAGTDTDSHVWRGEAVPLITAKNGFYYNGNLYYTDGSYLRFTILNSGSSQVLCFDPLCRHDEDGYDENNTCAALAPGADDINSRVLVYDGNVWFKTEVFSYPATYYQLRCIDLDTMKLTIYMEKNEKPFSDFWFYGNELYLSMASQAEDENGVISYYGGSIYRLDKNNKPTMVVEDKASVQLRLLASGEGCLYYGGKYGAGEIYRTSPDFSYTEIAAVLPNVKNIQFYGDYVYYQMASDEKISAYVPDIEGDFDESLSNIKHSVTKYALYRIKLNGSGTPEIVYESMPAPRSNYAVSFTNYYIDGGMLYLTPLEPVFMGYTIWEPDTMMLQMGAGGKDILTCYFSDTNGRLIEIDTETLEEVNEYTGLCVDIIDIYKIEDGQLMGMLASIDPEVRNEKGRDSYKTYEYSGIIRLE